MLLLNEGQTKNIVVTLTEKTTLDDPYYLFVFTHLTTKEVVKIIKSSGDDLSDYPRRYNEFSIDATLFPSLGQWLYQVYEQESSTNEDPTGLTEVENGKMNLLAANDFTYAKYEPSTTYKTYAG